MSLARPEARISSRRSSAPRSLTPLLGETVLPDPWVFSMTEHDDRAPRGVAGGVVLYMVGTANEAMLERARRDEMPGWDALCAAERERIAAHVPRGLCELYCSRDLGRTWAPTDRTLFGSLASLGYGRVEIWAPEVHSIELEDGTRTLVGLYTTRRDGRSTDAERVVPIAPKWIGKFDFGRHLVIGQMVGPSFDALRILPEPLVDSFYGVLDAHLFQHPITKACRLFWKEDQTAHDLASEMWMQDVEVTREGVRRLGEPTRILTADPATWHGVTVEGMAVFHDDTLPHGWVFLLFSGNECFDDRYGTGCLKLSLETGETELLERPILCRETSCVGGELVGVGHPSVVTLPPGDELVIAAANGGTRAVRHLMFAHAWRSDDVYGVTTDRRRPYVFGLVVEDGWPKVVALP